MNSEAFEGPPLNGAPIDDAVAFAPATVSSPTPPISTTPSQQEQGDVPSPAGASATTPPHPAVDEFADPKISQLHAMFPDLNAAALYSAVDSVGGDQGRAVDALLAVSDPDYAPVPNESPSVAEQTQLDEEFARRLLEDDQQYAHEQNAQLTPVHYPQQANRGDAARQQVPLRRSTMTDVQGHISKLTKTGKRTLSSFVTKVKAKSLSNDAHPGDGSPYEILSNDAHPGDGSPYEILSNDAHPGDGSPNEILSDDAHPGDGSPDEILSNDAPVTEAPAIDVTTNGAPVNNAPPSDVPPDGAPPNVTPPDEAPSNGVELLDENEDFTEIKFLSAVVKQFPSSQERHGDNALDRASKLTTKFKNEISENDLRVIRERATQ